MNNASEPADPRAGRGGEAVTSARGVRVCDRCGGPIVLTPGAAGSTWLHACTNPPEAT